jgi:DNA-binding MarR family transcriptional regulator
MLVSLNQMRALVNSLAANLGPAQDAAIPVPSVTPRDPAKPRLNRPAAAADAEVDESKDVSDLAQRIKRLIRAQNSRSLFFDAALFSDPCWEMLLDLMSNHLLGREISVSSLCIASGVPQTTALRRIDDLAQANLIERVADPADRRRVFIRLKDDTVKKLDRYLQSFWSIASEAEPARRA